MKVFFSYLALSFLSSTLCFGSAFINMDGSVNQKAVAERCGPLMTKDTAYSHFAPGENTAYLGEYQLMSFRRACSVPGGCTGTIPTNSGDILGHFSFDQWPRFQTFKNFPETGQAILKYEPHTTLTTLHIENNDSRFPYGFRLNSGKCRGSVGYYSSVYVAPEHEQGTGDITCDVGLWGPYVVSLDAEKNLEFKGRIYDHCLILSDSTQEKLIYLISEF
jgi:hypothetical protein